MSGPAIKYGDGDKEWYLNGKRHRIDGPAQYNKYFIAWYVHDHCYYSYNEIVVRRYNEASRIIL